MRRHVTVPNLLATLFLVAVLAQTAPAAPLRATISKLVTGKQVKDKSLTGADVKNGSLTAAKLAKGVPTTGSAGAPGAGGAKGATGDKGETGDKGAGGDKGATGDKGAIGNKGAPGTFRSRADARDVWAFVTPTTHANLNVIATFGPSQSPRQALEQARFDDDIAYEIHFARGASSLADVVTYQFRFTTSSPAQPSGSANPAGQLSDQVQPTTQTYTVRRVVGATPGPVLGPFNVAPPRYGTRTDTAAYQATYDDTFAGTFIAQPGANGTRSWAGPRDDPAFADTAAMSDLWNIPDAAPVDGLGKHNVMTIALEIPSTLLTFDGNIPANAAGTANLLGVWTSTKRLLDGTFTQVSRAGQPLFPYLFLPASERAAFMALKPADDIAQIADRIVNPLLVNELEQVNFYGGPAPNGTKTGRVDLLDIFDAKDFPTAGAHPGVAPSTILRVDLGVDSGWPNGRLLTDDTTDVLMSVIALKALTGVTDNISANDKTFLATFPFAALPWRPSEG